MRKTCIEIAAAGVIALAWLATAGAAPPSHRGLVAYWDFDEPSGMQAADQASGETRGTLRGSPAAARVDGPFDVYAAD
jgi:hypothetical protein